MKQNILIGTATGLVELDGERATAVETLSGHAITALALDGDVAWALTDGAALWQRRDGRWARRAGIEGPPARCLAPAPGGVWIGTAQAHVLRFGDEGLRASEAFDRVEGRQAWYTPWGAPADVRSIAAGRDGAVYANVHVGGVAATRDDGATWAPLLDIDVDVHQVLAHPVRAEVVLVAAAAGFGVSRDAGRTWQFLTAGLHAHYLRAVTVAGDDVVISASAGFHGKRAALYRKPLDGGRFERCRDGLPTWFDDNVDTACLAADGALVACGTQDGRVFRSRDGGRRWELALKGLAPVGCLTIGR
ncbi:MAG TPA: hypothetical protein VFL90_10480 [Methylomirabilota bacterium]|nr:hypothetical protein [Methylomirabilota bacterium]